MNLLLAVRRAALRALACRERARPVGAPFLHVALFAASLSGGLAIPVRAQSRVVAAVDSAARPDREGSVLARRVTIDFNDLPLGLALHLIAQEGHLRLSYSSDVVPIARRVSVSRENAPVGEVLRDALASTNIDPVVTPSGYVVLVKNPSASPATGVPTVPDMTVAARAPMRAQVIDRVLIMGTPAAGAPERELPSAVTVLTAAQIATYGPSSMQDLLRSGIPGIVAWDLGIAGPFAQIGSVRGSSSFTSNYLKTYVDGVELASPYLLFAVDPYSIERIEIIRGPQGSALYGSDAISGVVHVITRRGSPSAEWRPTLDAQFSGGLVASRYAESGAITSQRHSAMLSSGGGRSSLGLGGTWSAMGGIVPGGQSDYRASYGGFRHLAGFLRVEGTMRYSDVRFTAPENPLLRADTMLNQVRSVLRYQRIENETYGLTLDANPAEGIRHTLVVGIDRNDGAIPLQREPATVADALLGATRERASKTSLRFSTSLRLVENTSSGATLTFGTDQTALKRERLGITTEVGGDSTNELAALYHDDITNSGVFAQLKIDVARSLFITAGLRGDANSTFGEDLVAAWSPMLGMAWTRDASIGTVKLRGAYGKGIRPPPPSAKLSIATLKFRQVANPALEPETQSGFEGGVEWFAGDRAMISLTGYTQVARGLIQQVIQDRRTIMYQNVGQIANRGAEIEGQVRHGNLRANGTFSLTDSRVRALARTYSGDLSVGDRVPEVPTSSGSLAVSWDVARTTFTMGSAYIGPWTGYDWSRYVGDEAQESAEITDLRSYWRHYQGIFRPYVSVSHILNRDVEWFGRVDNLTNVQRFERDNLQVTAGRTMTVGFRIGRN